jgi:hypothetical protein
MNAEHEPTIVRMFYAMHQQIAAQLATVRELLEADQVRQDNDLLTKERRKPCHSESNVPENRAGNQPE